MIRLHRKTIIILIVLGVIVLLLTIIKLTSKPSLPPPQTTTPSPIPIASPPPLYFQPIAKTVVTPPKLVLNPSVDLSTLPSSSVVYTFTQPTITKDQFVNIAQNLGIDSTPRSITDPVQGALYQIASGEQSFQAKVVPLTLSYSKIGSFRPLPGKFPPDSQLLDSTNQIVSKFSPPINFQPQINQKRYLKVVNGNPMPSSETSADIIEINLTPQVNSLPVISAKSNLFPSYAHLNKHGTLLTLEMTPFSAVPLANYPLLPPTSITAEFPQTATLVYYDRFNSQSKISQMTATTIILAYLLTTHDSINKLLVPIYLIQGNVSIGNHAYSATAIMPAIKPEYFLTSSPSPTGSSNFPLQPLAP